MSQYPSQGRPGLRSTSLLFILVFGGSLFLAGKKNLAEQERLNLTRQKQTQAAAVQHAEQGADRIAQALRSFLLSARLETLKLHPKPPAEVEAILTWKAGSPDPESALSFGKLSQNRDEFLALTALLSRKASDTSVTTFWVDSRLVLTSDEAGMRTFVVVKPRRETLLPPSVSPSAVRAALVDGQGMFQLHSLKGMEGARITTLATEPRSLRTLEGWQAFEAFRAVQGFPVTFRSEVVYRPEYSPILRRTDVVMALAIALSLLIFLQRLALRDAVLLLLARILRARATDVHPMNDSIVPAPGEGAPTPPPLGSRKATPPPMKVSKAVPPVMSRTRPVLTPPPFTITAAMEKLAEARSELSEAVSVKRRSRDSILFERLALALHPRDGGKAPALRVISDYMASPILFFEFDALHSVARLTVESGLDQDLSILMRQPLAFPVTGETLLKLNGLDVEAQGDFFCEYAPLARILLSKMGVAHYEAWPVQKTLIRDRPEKRLIGVLVVLQPGVDSFLNREGLLEMLGLLGQSYAELPAAESSGKAPSHTTEPPSPRG